MKQRAHNEAYRSVSAANASRRPALKCSLPAVDMIGPSLLRSEPRAERYGLPCDRFSIYSVVLRQIPIP
jgi:hypothetical protein